jgi:hypothetical protein
VAAGVGDHERRARPHPCRHADRLSGVWRARAIGSGSPTALLKNCRSASTRVTVAIGALSSRAAMRVVRSNASSGGESSSRVAAGRRGARGR